MFGVGAGVLWGLWSSLGLRDLGGVTMGTWNLSPTFVTLRALGVPKRGAFWSVVSPVLH